jgi:uncharacterized protein with NRDE domain
MCLIVLAYRQHPRFKLIVAANRDEFYSRPTVQAAFWEDNPHMLAGRDLEQLGTWLGITTTGRFAALTNFRDPTNVKSTAPSRGGLVRDFLQNSLTPLAYLEEISQISQQYNGFNLLIGDAHNLYYYSNQLGGYRQLPPGIYGLSNHLLDTPWPKVETAKAAMANCLEHDHEALEGRLFELLADSHQVADEKLPNTGIGLAWERVLSPAFITSDDYGTRSSTLILEDYAGKVKFIEKAFPGGHKEGYEF